MRSPIQVNGKSDERMMLWLAEMTIVDGKNVIVDIWNVHFN